MKNLPNLGRNVVLSAVLLTGSLGLYSVGSSSLAYYRSKQGTYKIQNGPISASGIPWKSILSDSGSQLDLGKGSAVFFVYNTTCSSCSRNMENVLAMIEAVKVNGLHTQLVATSAEDDSTQQAWYKHLRPNSLTHAKILDINRFVTAVGGAIVPATVLISNGKVVEVHNGLLGPEHRNRLIQKIKSFESGT